MNETERRLAENLRRLAAFAPEPPTPNVGATESDAGGPIGAAWRRVVVASVAASIVAVSIVGVIVARHAGSTDVVDGFGQWRSLPTPPTSARANALGLWTGHEALFIGGDTSPCAPGVSCDAQVTPPSGAQRATRTGVAFDPTTDDWRQIAPAPGFVDSDSQGVVAGSIAFVRTGRGWFAYDADADSWAPFDARWDDAHGVAAEGTRVFGVAGDRVVGFDSETGAWRTYPADPLEPALTAAQVAATPDGPVLAGFDSTRPQDVGEPSRVLVDVWTGDAWQRVETGQAGITFLWSGRRLVDPSPGLHDEGDEETFADPIPWGGAVDVSDLTWSELPPAVADPPDSGWRVVGSGPDYAAAGVGLFAVDGLVYNDTSGRVAPLPQPDGSAESFASGVWADGELIVFGGATFPETGQPQLSNQAFAYTP